MGIWSFYQYPKSVKWSNLEQEVESYGVPIRIEIESYGAPIRIASYPLLYLLPPYSNTNLTVYQYESKSNLTVHQYESNLTPFYTFFPLIPIRILRCTNTNRNRILRCTNTNRTLPPSIPSSPFYYIV